MIKNKVSIIVDSSAGISKKEADRLGIYFIPIIIDFEGREYESGIEIDNNFLIKNMTKDTKVKTAAVRLGDLENIMKEASENSDKVIFISLSKHLSSVNSSAKLTAKQFNNVIVYDSEFITPWLNYLLEDIVKLANVGNMNSIIDKLNSFSGKMFGYLMPANLDTLYAGGRISRVQYLVGSIAKIVPTIPAQNGKINSGGVIKAKGFEKALKKVSKIIVEDVKEWEKRGYTVKVGFVNIGNLKRIKLMKNKLKEDGLKNLFFDTIMAPEIVAHIGPGAITVLLIIE